jgi:colanic acid/amylovoran biosynthesis protein
MTKQTKLRILITGTNSTFDNGDAAMSSMAIMSLKKILPNSSFVIGSTYCFGDEARYKRMLPNESKDVTIVGAINSAKVPQAIRAVLVILRYIPEFFKADFCVDISGDGYSDVAQHSFASSITHNIQLLIAISLRKKVAICAQSIGPFKKTFTRSLARYVIDRVSLVTVRETISKKYLRSIGVANPNIELTGDLAFLLDPVSAEKAKNFLTKENVPVNHALVGIAVSDIISDWAFPDIKDRQLKYTFYIDSMIKLADYFVEKFCCTVLLIPQSIGQYARHDDRRAMRNIWKGVKNTKDVVMIAGEYTPQEIRAIIGQCQLIVSGKMHSAIAAVSMYIPVVVLAYSYKTPGIFGAKLDLNNAIIDVRSIFSTDFLSILFEKVNQTWNNREEISKKITYQRF